MKKLCRVCGEEFILKPGKPGYANICEDCTGLHPSTPLPKPVAPRKPASIRSATLELLRAVEAIEGRPDPALRAMVQPLLTFRLPRRKGGAQ